MKLAFQFVKKKKSFDQKFPIDKIDGILCRGLHVWVCRLQPTLRRAEMFVHRRVSLYIRTAPGWGQSSVLKKKHLFLF